MWRFALFIAVLVLIGCGGSSTKTEASISTREDRIAIASVELVLRTHLNLSGAAWATKAAEAMRANAAFSNVEDDGKGTVTAMLPSGATYAVVDNRPGISRSVTESQTRQWVAGEIPRSGMAVVMDSFIGDFGHSTTANEVATAMTRAGYRLYGGRVLRGTIPELKALLTSGRIGLFYFDGHGFKDPNYFTRSYQYGMITASEVPEITEEEDDPYTPDLARRTIGYTSVRVRDTPGGDLRVSRRYYIKAKFWTEYLRFASRSVVWPNTCYSAFAGSELIQQGVGLALGWTEPVSDEHAMPTSLAFFNHTLNLESEIQDWQETKATLTTANLMRDAFTGAELRFETPTAGVSHLVPEIDSATRQNDLADSGQAELVGTFGNVRGRVLNKRDGDEEEVPIASWTPTKIVLNYARPLGALRVEVDGVKSNTYAFDRWIISGPNGGPFYMRNRFHITRADRDLTVFTPLLREPVGSPTGMREPFTFYAKRDERLGLAMYTDSTIGGYGQLFLTRPDGARRQLLPAFADQTITNPVGLVNMLIGWFYLDRF